MAGATCTATTRVHGAILTRQDLEDLTEQDPATAARLMTAIVHRLAERLPALLGKGGVPGCIRVETSGKDRANESAYYFMESLAKRVDFVADSKDCYVSQQNPSEIDKGLRNKFELYFHKTTPEGDYARYLPAYESYQRFIGDEDAAIAPLQPHHPLPLRVGPHHQQPIGVVNGGLVVSETEDGGAVSFHRGLA